MTNLRLSYVACASALALGVNGCASVQAPPKMVEIRPAATPAEPPGSAVTNLYQMAVSAIERRDYTRALDLLQDARDRAPQDARVLNAFGVVYDKLGRFDLSGRYYAQAQAADPGSAIVAENRAYSNVLQGKAPAPVLASQDTAGPSVAAVVRPVELAPVAVATATPPAPLPSPGPVRAAPLTRSALAQPPHFVPEARAAPEPVAVASAPAPAPSATNRAPVQPAQAAPVALAALAIKPTTRDAQTAPTHTPVTVLAALPTTPRPLSATAPLPTLSIQPQPALNIRMAAPQRAVKLAELPSAPVVIPAADKVALAPASPLPVLQPHAVVRIAEAPMAPLAVRTLGSAMMASSLSTQSVAAKLATRPVRVVDATNLRQVDLQAFEVASSLQLYAPPGRAPDHATPATQPAVKPGRATERREGETFAMASAETVHIRVASHPDAATRHAPVAPQPRKVAVTLQKPAAPTARLVSTQHVQSPSVKSVSWKATPAAMPVAPAANHTQRTGFIGRPLVIVDGSGIHRAGETVRLQLARLGWTVPASRLQPGAGRSQTTIRYAGIHAMVARALANSLRIPVKLERCGSPCQGVSLILGADARPPAANVRSTAGLRRLS